MFGLNVLEKIDGLELFQLILAPYEQILLHVQEIQTIHLLDYCFALTNRFQA